MLRCATAAVLAVLASVPFASSADKADKAKKPTGAWSHTLNECTVTYTFEDDTLRCEFRKSDNEYLNVDASYGVTADGLVFGVVTRLEQKGTDAGPPRGSLFSFQYKIDKDVLTISELTSNKDISDDGRQLLSGQFTAKKPK